MTLNCSTFTQFFTLMLGTIPYNQALNFATCCCVEHHFLNVYGSALNWQESRIDLGELMDFIEKILDNRK
jgi:hypothetical protein